MCCVKFLISGITVSFVSCIIVYPRSAPKLGLLHCQEIITRSCSTGSLNTNKFNIEVLFRKGPGSRVDDYGCKVSIGFGVTTAAYVICLYAIEAELDQQNYEAFQAAAPLLWSCLRVFGMFDPEPTPEMQAFKTIRGTNLETLPMIVYPVARSGCVIISCGSIFEGSSRVHM